MLVERGPQPGLAGRAVWAGSVLSSGPQNDVILGEACEQTTVCMISGKQFGQGHKPSSTVRPSFLFNLS